MATTHPCSNLHHILVALCLFMLPTLMPAQNITFGSSLTAGANSTSWNSPSGDFAFGFQKVPSDDDNIFLLAIWFDKIEEKTVVWFAKPTNASNGLVKSGSKVEIKRDGRLVLSDPSGDELWTAINTTNNGNSHARMLDNGNFVLEDARTNRLLWQSFENPTDTLLPTQGLKPGVDLVARLLDDDYSDGRFKLSVKDSGNITAYLTSLTGANYDPPYWGSNTTGNDPNLVFDKLGNVNVVLRNATPVEIMPQPLSSGGLLYQRLTLDVDGVLRHYFYPRNNTRSGTSSTGWNINGRGIPSNICKSVTTYLGGGACGYNSYCTMGNNNMPNCQCPPKYSFLDPKRKYKGCKPDFDIPTCTSTTDPTFAQYEMITLYNTDFQWGDYEQYMGAENEETCKTECLKDCFCHVVVFNPPNCWVKQQPLSNGWRDSSKGAVVLLKVSKSNTSFCYQQSPLPTAEQAKRKGSLVSWLLFGSSTTINFLLVAIIIIFVYKGCGRKMSNRQSPIDPNLRGSSLQTFTYEELTEATSGFEHELGRGAFGIVYKGTLSLEKPITIAVKKLGILEKGKEKEFANELKAIGQTYHKNLVRLLGFCNEGQHRLLVYEFMSNCSLTTLLFGVPKPDWNKRMNIANGIASGLLYLHEECATPIVHCDIKPQNVLLDEHFVPKISDFGLAKLLRTDQSKMSTGITGIRGTRGYVAPEWFKRVAITAKVDIYSFGVMLLEIICSRRNVELEFGEGEEAILTDWAYDCFREGKLDVLLEHNDEAIEDIRRLERYVMVALWCIQEDPALRPSMKKVVQMLEGAAEVPIPPDPSSFYSSNSSTF